MNRMNALSLLTLLIGVGCSSENLTNLEEARQGPGEGLHPAVIDFSSPDAVQVPETAQAGQAVTIRVTTLVGHFMDGAKGETRVRRSDRELTVEPYNEFISQPRISMIVWVNHEVEVVFPEPGTYFVTIGGRSPDDYSEVTRSFEIDVR